jgi:hypothetical protein
MVSLALRALFKLRSISSMLRLLIKPTRIFVLYDWPNSKVEEPATNAEGSFLSALIACVHHPNDCVFERLDIIVTT